MSENQKLDAALADVDEAKRATLNRLITGTAFVVPIVASYAIDGLTISQAQAQTGNGSGHLVSDQRLKTGVARIGGLPCGLGLYRFRYIWDDVEYVGVMAQEVLDVMPSAVAEDGDGFLSVDYGMLGLEMVTYRSWQQRNAGEARLSAA